MTGFRRNISRRDFLKAFGAGAVSIFLGCREDDNQPISAYSPHHDPVTASLEKEVRRMDSWVGDWLVQDYNKKDPPGQIGLVFRDAAKTADGWLSAEMLYHRGADDIIIPLRAGKAVDPRNISHELWHSLYDPHDELGLIHRPGYRGPQLEEIAEFAKKKVKDPAFQELRDGLRKSQLEQEVRHLTNYIGSTIEYIELIEEMVSHTNELVFGYSDFLSYLPDETRKILASGQITEQYDELIQSIADFISWKERTIDGFKGDVDSPLDLDTLEELNESIRHHYGSIKNARQGLGFIVEMYRHIHDDFESAVKARFDMIEKEITRRISDPEYSEGHAKLKRALENVNQDRKQTLTRLVMDSAMNYGADSKIASLELSDGVDWIVSRYNQNEIGKILGEPDEVMARVVQSLYCLHYGEVEQNLFPLTYADLDFLERFEYEGRKMFAKGIEKYRLGLQMIDDGYSADSVKEMLGYATSFSYKGRMYSWPEADFAVKGEIPVESQ